MWNTAQSGPTLQSHCLRCAVVYSVDQLVIRVASVLRFGTARQVGAPAWNADTYGNSASVTTPFVRSTSNASLGHHPPQLGPWIEQKWSSASERSAKTALCSIVAIASTIPHAQNDTQLPHAP